MTHPQRWLVILVVGLLAMSASPSAEAAQPLVPTNAVPAGLAPSSQPTQRSASSR
jgi:hypothetical protein